MVINKYKKSLSDGLCLEMYEYQLSDGGADALGRPRKSQERYLAINYPTGVTVLQTHPSSSWDLSKDQFMEIFDSISDSCQFVRVKHFLDCGGIANYEPRTGGLAEIIHQFPKSDIFHSSSYDLNIEKVMRAKQRLNLALE
jgi:hypothetical protein